MNKRYSRGIGVMSGTSLDGLDLAYCEFSWDDGIVPAYRLLHAETIAYSAALKKSLQQAYSGSAEQYFESNATYGSFIAAEIQAFIQKHGLITDFIASHGHTVFHRPALGFSTQMGCGATIAAHTDITTVCDFRSLDVANGGQGAPLVPIGDELLFGQYAACLNLGGIANISFGSDQGRKAFDICVINMALNHFSEMMGRPYDDGGELAASGRIQEPLLKALNAAQARQNHRSLGREFFEKEFLPVTRAFPVPVEDILATCVEHSAQQIAQVLREKNLKNVLVTGGGAYNTYFIERLKTYYPGDIIVPDDLTIQFKEALVFAFLGYLRLRDKTNTLKSVTGAKSDSVGGAVYFVK
ncbi:MAG: anhydro-N-acetylmuramic acid kinase [Bacteroidetes bacterium]|nr:anhydro-N-acetylmuramic acid kinase [Bacteroidota bacterium]